MAFLGKKDKLKTQILTKVDSTIEQCPFGCACACVRARTRAHTHTHPASQDIKVPPSQDRGSLEINLPHPDKRWGRGG